MLDTRYLGKIREDEREEAFSLPPIYHLPPLSPLGVEEQDPYKKFELPRGFFVDVVTTGLQIRAANLIDVDTGRPAKIEEIIFDILVSNIEGSDATSEFTLDLIRDEFNSVVGVEVNYYGFGIGDEENDALVRIGNVEWIFIIHSGPRN